MFENYQPILNLESHQLRDEYHICSINVQRLLDKKYSDLNTGLFITGGYVDDIISSQQIPDYKSRAVIKDYDFFGLHGQEIRFLSKNDFRFFGMAPKWLMLDPVERFLKVKDSKIFYRVNFSQAESILDHSSLTCYATPGYLKTLQTGRIYPPAYWETHGLDYVLEDVLESFISPILRAMSKDLELDESYFPYLEDVLAHDIKLDPEHVFNDVPKFLAFSDKKYDIIHFMEYNYGQCLDDSPLLYEFLFKLQCAKCKGAQEKSDVHYRIFNKIHTGKCFAV